MQTADLTTQLASLTDSLKQTNALITRLSTINFQPGSEPLADNDPSSVRIEIAQDIHDCLKQFEEELELLTQEVEDLTSTNTPSTVGAHRRREDSERDRDSARLAAQVARLTEDLRASRSKFRRAQLSAKKASEAAKQRERELVFSSLRDPPPPPALDQANSTGTPDLFAGRRKLTTQQKSLTKEELEVDASTSVTTALRRTHDLLSTELSRSRFAQETFDQSTAALNELGEHYSNLDTVLKGSRELLGTLLRSQKSDTWYLETAFYILVGTLCWLFVKRILWGPVYQLPSFLWRWFVWPVLGGLLSVTGVYSPGSTAVRASQRFVSGTTRPPLIVQPSASRGSQPRFPEGMSGINVPAGSGGENAKVGKEGLEGKMSEAIGRMAEENREKGQAGGDVGSGAEPVKRADGTVLEERGDVPRNPKKKMFDTKVEDAKHEEQLREQREDHERKRDEL